MPRHFKGTRTRRGLLATLAATTLLIAGWPTSAPAAQEPISPNLADFKLEAVHKSPVDLPERVELLDAELPKLGVQNILDTGNHTAEQGGDLSTCNPDAIEQGLDLRGPNFCFTAADSATVDGVVEWMPQGITTVGDAQDDQLWGSKEALMVSWYDKPPPEGQGGGDADEVKGCRVTFLDPETLKYRHVLLAYPYMNSYDNPSYMSLRTSQFSDEPGLHCGGMAWYGFYLYVADTAKGFRVFDTRYIFDLGEAENGDTSDKSQIGRQSGVYYGHGYRFVMPEVAAWRNTVDRNECDHSGAPSFSFVGLDRSTVPDALTTGEFCSADDAGGDPNKMGRVARWPLDGSEGSDGEPLLDDDGNWQAHQAYQMGVPNIQGALSFDDRWYLSRSNGKTSNGYLYVTQPMTADTGVLEIDTVRRAAIGVEDLSHWPSPDGGLSDLYTVTEWPGRRLIYACQLSSLDSYINTELCGEDPNPPE